ncbi:apolipoprotein A-IV-like [Syngnathus acus]|uniref:apolipoprotein A-IV-like n=1 Tax=Syngnathus acus TaxID=161584 RepID=UPI00188601CC|nr:apolipoprotein A-IV-like [Syngnathus acus]XP_037129302.1 apolipoprotein A-IV-like [Syngnathus acus]
MRVFVLLALTLVSGCNGNLFHADAPKPPMEALTDAFWDYIAKASKTADDTLEMVMKSEFGAEVNAQLAETADMASKYASALKEKLPLAAQGLVAKIGREADVLKKVLSQDLGSVTKKVELYSNAVKAQIQERLDQLRQELAAYADNMDSDLLKWRSEELMAGLMSSISDAERNLQPFTQELMNQVDAHLVAFQHNISPMADRLQTELYHGSRQVQRVVAPYAEDLKEKLDHFAIDLQEHLKALVTSN